MTLFSCSRSDTYIEGIFKETNVDEDKVLVSRCLDPTTKEDGWKELIDRFDFMFREVWKKNYAKETTDWSYEDYRQSVLCSLVGKLPTWDSQRGKLSTFIWIVAETEIKHRFTYNSYQKRRGTRIFKPENWDSTDEEWLDSLGNVRPAVIKNQGRYPVRGLAPVDTGNGFEDIISKRDMLKKILLRLPAPERDLLLKYANSEVSYNREVKRAIHIARKASKEAGIAL